MNSKFKVLLTKKLIKVRDVLVLIYFIVGYLKKKSLNKVPGAPGQTQQASESAAALCA